MFGSIVDGMVPHTRVRLRTARSKDAAALTAPHVAIFDGAQEEIVSHLRGDLPMRIVPARVSLLVLFPIFRCWKERRNVTLIFRRDDLLKDALSNTQLQAFGILRASFTARIPQSNQ
jgi:hypothetical protein